ncbi:EF-hand calcium-binding domain containing protein [Entamoeba histolytica HM-1:IMSS-B]|uniref:EF-hand calcium-binding domain containing protein n=1 Tax=Entamoeba histolytica HM-1:IMSS-B TaxID=885319 RepID=M3USP9_ENTH1|nr:EF-hand calcium-binding domain containing protein [Entamoeba histolytica HM-1:IMSS-B]
MYGYPVGGMNLSGYPMNGICPIQPMGSVQVGVPVITNTPGMVTSVPVSALCLWNLVPSSNSWLNSRVQCQIMLDPMLRNNWWWNLVQSVSVTQFNSVYMWFLSVDTDRSGTIEINELMMAQFPGGITLTPQTALRLMRIFDVDFNGRISFYEYMGMHKFLEICYNVFIQCDTNRSGTMEPHEIIPALRILGFFVNQRTAIVLHRLFAHGSTICDLNCWIALCAFAAQTRTAYQLITMNPYYGIIQPFNPIEFGKFLDIITSLLE